RSRNVNHLLRLFVGLRTGQLALHDLEQKLLANVIWELGEGIESHCTPKRIELLPRQFLYFPNHHFLYEIVNRVRAGKQTHRGCEFPRTFANDPRLGGSSLEISFCFQRLGLGNRQTHLRACTSLRTPSLDRPCGLRTPSVCQRRG